MKEYLNKYPQQKSNVDALLYSYGLDETDTILNNAIKENKILKLITDESKPDFLDYIII